MRIALVFLMLVVVSIAGVGVLARTVFRDGILPIAAFGAGQAGQETSRPAAPAAAPPTEASRATAAPRAAEGETVTFTIQQGETTASIARRLADMGLVGNATIFRFYVQWKGAEGKLQAGDYQLRQGMSMDELTESLQAAKAKDVPITFVEGRRIEEFADTLRAANVGIDADRFLDLARRGNFAYDFLEGKPAGATLEGFLFPDTYRVIPGKTTPEELIHQMLKRFGDSLPPPLREQAKKNTGLSAYETVILASIVEREAQMKSERPTIAAVYVNRLRSKEPLGADATVQYAIAKPGDWWPQLRDQARNISPESPFNSYTHAGLPPNPIANPGAAALKAAAEPDKVDYLFYVRNDVKNDGSHVFARTLAEHQQNIVKFQRP